jgi:SNF2 family DNA or RNA helicase
MDPPSIIEEADFPVDPLVHPVVVIEPIAETDVEEPSPPPPQQRVVSQEEESDDVLEWDESSDEAAEPAAKRQRIDTQSALIEQIISMEPCPCSYDGCLLDILDDYRSTMVIVHWKNCAYADATETSVSDLLDIANLRTAIETFEAKIRKLVTHPPSTHAGSYPGYGSHTFSLLTESPSLGSGLTLHDYQLEGVNFMLYNWSEGRNSLLADEMGLGKTLQVLSLFRVLWERYSCYGPFIVVAPLVTLTHWKRECERACPGMVSLIYHGNRDERVLLADYEFLHNCAAEKKRAKVHKATKVRYVDREFLWSFYCLSIRIAAYAICFCVTILLR